MWMGEGGGREGVFSCRGDSTAEPCGEQDNGVSGDYLERREGTVRDRRLQ